MHGFSIIDKRQRDREEQHRACPWFSSIDLYLLSSFLPLLCVKSGREHMAGILDRESVSDRRAALRLCRAAAEIRLSGHTWYDWQGDRRPLQTLWGLDAKQKKNRIKHTHTHRHWLTLKYVYPLFFPVINGPFSHCPKSQRYSIINSHWIWGVKQPCKIPK